VGCAGTFVSEILIRYEIIWCFQVASDVDELYKLLNAITMTAER